MSCFMCSDDHLRVVAIASLLPARVCGVHEIARVLSDLESLVLEHEAAIGRGDTNVALYASRREDLRVLAELHAMNAESVGARYGKRGREDMGADDAVPALTASDYARLRSTLVRPLAIAKLARSYAYQSCETPAWEHSACDDRVNAIVSFALGCTPGYDAAPWTI